MKRLIKILMVFIMLFSIFSSQDALAATEEEMNEMRQAVLEIMQAYYRRGSSVQYDSYRRNMYFSPEDATSQSYIYTVCSGYPNMVYYQAFGISISPYTDYMGINAKKFKTNTSMVPLYLEGSEEVHSLNGIGSSDADIDAVVQHFKSFVKVGDILVVRRTGDTSWGHAMIFGENDESGEPYIYESGGKRYSTELHNENYEEAGSLAKLPLRTIIHRYIHATTEPTEVLVLRYINENNEYINHKSSAEVETYDDLNESARSRLKYSKMDITKTSKIENSANNNTRNSVTPGDVIEYSIKVKNNSSSNYSNVKIIETLDENVSLINSENYDINDNNINWTIPSIAAGEEKTITYKVKVKNSNSILGKFITSTGFVDSIKNRTINLFVSNSLTSEEQKKLVDKYNSMKNSSEKNDIDFLIDLYKESLGIDISYLSGKTFSQYVKHNGCTDSSCKLYIGDDKIKSFTLGNYYNIRLGAISINDDGNVTEEDVMTDLQIKALYGWYNYNKDDVTTRPRELIVSDFQIGDIIIARKETSGEMYDKAYIYVGDGVLGRRFGSLLEYSDGTNGRIPMQQLINDFNEDNYIVLRPAMLLNREYQTEDDLTIKVDNTSKTQSIILLIISCILISIGTFVIVTNQHKKRI